MKIKNSIIVAGLAMSAALAGATTVDWNNPQLSSADMSAVKVAAPASKPVVRLPKLPTVKLSFSILRMRLKLYVGKSVTTEAVLANKCGSAKPCYTLQVGVGSKEDGLAVIAFLPLRVPHHAKKPFPIMDDLVGKRLQLTGTIESETTIVKGVPSVSFKFRVNKYKIVIKK